MKMNPVPLGEKFRARFDVLVDRSGGFFACHPFTGRIDTASGYGRIHLGGNAFLAHRVAFTYAEGAIPEGAFVLHGDDCGKDCCNPIHLRLGDARDNAADATRNNRYGRSLDLEVVLAIRKLVGNGAPRLAVANFFDIRPQTVGEIMRGASHKNAASRVTSRGLRSADVIAANVMRSIPNIAKREFRAASTIADLISAA